MKDDDGTLAETIEDGYEIQGERAERQLKQFGADGVRVEFFNAFNDDPAHFKAFLLDLVKNLRSQHCCSLLELIGDAHSRVRNSERDQTLAVQKDAARPLMTWLKNNREPDQSNILRPERSLVSALYSAHPSSVRASVRRQGEWYNLDYSYQLGYGARLVVRTMVGKKLEAFKIISEKSPPRR